MLMRFVVEKLLHYIKKIMSKQALARYVQENVNGALRSYINKIVCIWKVTDMSFFFERKLRICSSIIMKS